MAKKGKIYEANIADLIADDQNANNGTEYGDRILEKSLQKLGAGRSVLVDKDGRLIAGNKTAMKAAEIGLNKAIVVETTGDELVVVKRVDVTLDSKQGRELALADNKVGQSNLEWDFNVADTLQATFDIDSDFMPEKPRKAKNAMWIKVTIQDELEMDEAAEEIEQLVTSKWNSAEVKVKR